MNKRRIKTKTNLNYFKWNWNYQVLCLAPNKYDEMQKKYFLFVFFFTRRIKELESIKRAARDRPQKPIS
jgi:hypothetical protein